MHPGTGPGLSPRSLGQKAGVQTVQLSLSEIPSHSHTANLKCNSGVGNAVNPQSNYLAQDAGGTSATYNTAQNNTDMGAASVQVQNAGGDGAHTNEQPFLCVNFIIALVGIFPSRS